MTAFYSTEFSLRYKNDKHSAREAKEKMSLVWQGENICVRGNLRCASAQCDRRYLKTLSAVLSVWRAARQIPRSYALGPKGTGSFSGGKTDAAWRSLHSPNQHRG